MVIPRETTYSDIWALRMEAAMRYRRKIQKAHTRCALLMLVSALLVSGAVFGIVKDVPVIGYCLLPGLLGWLVSACGIGWYDGKLKELDAELIPLFTKVMNNSYDLARLKAKVLTRACAEVNPET